MDFRHSDLIFHLKFELWISSYPVWLGISAVVVVAVVVVVPVLTGTIGKIGLLGVGAVFPFCL